jgi:hypothetical protein
VGYHVFAIQEAHADQMHQMHKHNWVLQQDQRIATRKPNRVQSVAHASIPGEMYWQVAEILFDKPRLGLNSLVTMSVHLNNPRVLEEAIDAAIKALQDAGRPAPDIVCGDINMARPPLSSHDNFGRSSGSLKNYTPRFDISFWLCMVAVCRQVVELRYACLYGPHAAPRCSSLLPVLAAPCWTVLLHASFLSAAPSRSQVGPKRTQGFGMTPLSTSSRPAASCPSPTGRANAALLPSARSGSSSST